MKFKGHVISLEDTSYKSGKGENVAQDRVTALDLDGPQTLKDTVDITFPREDRAFVAVGQVCECSVSEIRPPFQGGTRMRFTGRVIQQLPSEASATGKTK